MFIQLGPFLPYCTHGLTQGLAQQLFHSHNEPDFTNDQPFHKGFEGTQLQLVVLDAVLDDLLSNELAVILRWMNSPVPSRDCHWCC
jgi:hypothetical protein